MNALETTLLWLGLLGGITLGWGGAGAVILIDGGHVTALYNAIAVMLALLCVVLSSTVVLTLALHARQSKILSEAQ